MPPGPGRLKKEPQGLEDKKKEHRGLEEQEHKGVEEPEHKGL